MKIYLNSYYHGELCAGTSKILKVEIDADHPGRFFVIAGEKEREVLERMGMLEDQGPEDVSEVREDATPKDDVKKTPAPVEQPASYVCKIHKREHKAGSSAYIACFDQNFSSKTK